MQTRLTVARAGRWRIWRHIAAWGAAAVVASVGIAACSDDPLAPVPASPAAAPDPGPRGELSLENVGEFHNSFLDFAFPRMRFAVANGKSRADLCVVIAQAMRDFVAARRLAINPGAIRNDIAGGDCVSERAVSDPRGGPRMALAVNDVPVGELDIIVAEIAFAAAENLPLSSLSSVVNDKVAYARAYLPAEEADIVAATGEVALSSAGYWDDNFAYQEQALLEEAGLTEAMSRGGADTPRIAPNRTATTSSQSLAPPSARSDDWLTDIENHTWYPRARKVVAADIQGAVKGGISGWKGGLRGIVTGAAVEAGAASAGGFIREVFKPWSR